MAQALPEGVDRLTFIVGHQQDASKNQVVKGIPGFALMESRHILPQSVSVPGLLPGSTPDRF